MIYSIPVLRKIEILSTAASKLPMTSPTGASPSFRGSIVAVEGRNKEGIARLSEFLQNELNRGGEFQVELFSGPEVDEVLEDDGMAGILRTLGEWHGVSQKMVEFISKKQNNETAGRKPSSQSTEDITTSLRSAVGKDKISPAHEDDGAVSPRTIIPQTSQMSLASPINQSNKLTNTKSPIPIAIIPRYQLTTVDDAAISMPINDNYSAIDHWKWHAALWRGCAGPDLTIAVVKSDERNNEDTVEVRTEDPFRAMIIKKGKAETEVEEKALRRVAFEVEEYLRQ